MRTGLSPPAVVVAAVLLVSAVMATVPLAAAVLMPGIVGLLLLFALVRTLERDASEQRRLYSWTVLVFLTHVMFSGVLLLLYGHDFPAPDSPGYDSFARRITQHWLDGGPFPAPPSGKEGFPYMLAGLYWVFGFHPESGLVVNAVLSSALVPLVADITKRLFGTGAARDVPVLVLTVPGFLLWPGQLLREAGVLFLLATAVWCAVRLTAEVKAIPLVVLPVTLAVLFTFRGYVALVVTGALLTAVLFVRRGSVKGVAVLLVVALLLAAFVFAGIGRAGYDATTELFNLRTAAGSREWSTSFSSGYGAGTDVSSPAAAFKYLPVGVVHFMFGPLPWEVHKSRQAFGVLDSMASWVLVPLALGGVRLAYRQKRREWAAALLPACVLTCLYALLIGDYGTGIRVRPQVLLLLLPFASLALSARRRTVSSSALDERRWWAESRARRMGTAEETRAANAGWN